MSTEQKKWKVYPFEHDYILLHPSTPRWLAVNATGLQIAENIAKGKSRQQVIDQLAKDYNLSKREIEKDLGHVWKTLFDLWHSEPDIARKPKAFSLFMHTTTYCNFKCPHCYYLEHGITKVRHLATEKALALIEQLIDQGGQKIVISGGEPLLHPGLKQIIDFGEKYLEVHILTNGSMLNDEWVQFLAGKNVYIQISLDGPDEQSQDSWRGKGSFAAIMTAVDSLKKAGMGEKLRLSTTVMKHNIDRVQEIIDLAQKLQISQLRLLPLREDVGNSTLAQVLPPDSYAPLYDHLLAAQKNGQAMRVECGLSGLVLYAKEYPDEVWCPIGRQLVVDIDGSFYPCVLMMREQFLLDGKTIKEATESQTMVDLCRALTERRQKIEKCRSCDWQNLCQSGCMGQALEATNTIWDTDPYCQYRKSAYQTAFQGCLHQKKR